MQELKISISEKEEEIIQNYTTAFQELENLRNKLTKFQRDVGSSFTKELRNERDGIFALFRRNQIMVKKTCLHLFIGQIMPYIHRNPGCLQKALKNNFPENPEKTLYAHVSEYLYYLSKEKMITREKMKGSYQLFINDDIQKIEKFLVDRVKKEIALLNNQTL